MRRRPVLSLALVATAVVIVAALLAGAGEERIARVEVVAAEEPLRLLNSKDGAAVLQVTDLAPGQARSGEVTIANAGTAAGDLALGVGNVSDSPAGEAALSSALQLTVRDDGSGVQWSGPWDAFGPQAMGPIGPGESRTFTLTVTMPDAGDALQGATTRGDLVWTATTQSGGEPPEPPPPDTPPSPAPPAPPGDEQPPLEESGLLPASDLRLAFSPSRTVLRHRAASFRVRCRRACSVTAYTFVPSKKKRLRTRTKVVSVSRPGRPVRVRVRLSRPMWRHVRRQLRRSGRARLRLVVSVRDDLGRTRRVTHRLKVTQTRGHRR